MEIIRPLTARIKAALFDFDGTVSLIRTGWQRVMTPYFTEVLMSCPNHGTYDDEYNFAKEFIDRLTGKQTVYQCMALADAVADRGGQPLDPYAYKAEYLARLAVFIQERVTGLYYNRLDPDSLTVPGFKALADYLHGQGIKLYLASGTDEDSVREEAALLGVEGEFDGGIFGAKPDTADCSKEFVITHLLQAEELQGSEIIVFGDGPVELQLIREVGGYAVGVATDEENGALAVNPEKRERLINAGASAVIPNLTEAPALMETVIPMEPIAKALEGVKNVRAAVFGDICLDRYLYIEGDRDEVSLETGKTAYQVVRTAEYPGGGGNVAKNLAVFGADTTVCGLVGCEGEGYMLLRALERYGVTTAPVVTTPDRLTNVYMKPMYCTAESNGKQEELSRLDLHTFDALPTLYEQELLTGLDELFSTQSLILVADQFTTPGASVLTARVREELCRLAEEHPEVTVLVDSRGFASEYRNVIVKCNGREAVSAVTGRLVPQPSSEQIIDCGRALAARNSRLAIVTDGAEGVYIFEPEGEYSHVAAFKALGETDICGAGDAFLTGMGLGLALGLTAKESALLGNAAAGVAVKAIGITGSCSVEQALSILKGMDKEKSDELCRQGS